MGMQRKISHIHNHISQAMAFVREMRKEAAADRQDTINLLQGLNAAGDRIEAAAEMIAQFETTRGFAAPATAFVNTTAQRAADQYAATVDVHKLIQRHLHTMETMLARLEGNHQLDDEAQHRVDCVLVALRNFKRVVGEIAPPNPYYLEARQAVFHWLDEHDKALRTHKISIAPMPDDVDQAAAEGTIRPVESVAGGGWPDGPSGSGTSDLSAFLRNEGKAMRRDETLAARAGLPNPAEIPVRLVGIEEALNQLRSLLAMIDVANGATLIVPHLEGWWIDSHVTGKEQGWRIGCGQDVYHVHYGSIVAAAKIVDSWAGGYMYSDTDGHDLPQPVAGTPSGYPTPSSRW